jgi:hypothetical protein
MSAFAADVAQLLELDVIVDQAEPSAWPRRPAPRPAHGWAETRTA